LSGARAVPGLRRLGVAGGRRVSRRRHRPDERTEASHRRTPARESDRRGAHARRADRACSAPRRGDGRYGGHARAACWRDRRAPALVDWILTGGDVVTFDPARPRAEAVAIEGGRIVAVGVAAQIEQLATPATEVTDLEGAALLPGFGDTHMHLQKISCD